jgi:hypothetical protein
MGTPAQVFNPRKRRNKEERDTASSALSHDCGEKQVGVESFFCPEADSPPSADDGVTLTGSMQPQYIRPRGICMDIIMRTL